MYVVWCVFPLFLYYTTEVHRPYLSCLTSQIIMLSDCTNLWSKSTSKPICGRNPYLHEVVDTVVCTEILLGDHLIV